MLGHIWRWFVIPAIALLLAIGIYRFVVPSNVKEKVTEENVAAIGGYFELTNQHNQPVNATDFKGDITLVYFGFTHCPDICPADVALMSELTYLMESQQKKIIPVFITVDPSRDTVDVMHDYVANFHPSMQALTGSEEAVQKAVKAYRVFAQKEDEGKVGYYRVNHSGYTYVMSKTGKYLTHFSHGQTLEEMATKLEEYL